jgi:biotin carboxylase
MQVPVIDHAHRLGVRVLCFDGNPRAVARDRADWFEVCDIKDKELCLDRARAHRDASRLDGVVTVGTDFSTTVAWVAGALGLPGTPYEAALLAKDKGLMRARFAQAGVASPRYTVFEGLPPGPPDLGFPFPVVVKPVDNMGARGVRLVDRPADLVPALRDAVGFSGTGRVIVEEFIDGPEFSLDAIVRDGQVIRCGLADRTIVFPPSFVEIGHTFPSTASPAVREAVWAEFEKGVRALGLTWGAAKGDVKFSPSRGAVIGEIASRLSGGYMSGWTYPATSGRSAVLWAVETALGDPLSAQPDETAFPVVERAWIGLPGRLKSIRGVEAARAVPGVREVFLLVEPGRDTVFPRNNVEKLGNVIARAATPAEAEEAARRARNAVVFEYEAPHPATEAFLEGKGAEAWWFPQARGLADEGPAGWLTRAALGNWRDLYGNSLGDLVALLEDEGLAPHSRPPRFWRSLLVGGLSGARYAAAAP